LLHFAKKNKYIPIHKPLLNEKGRAEQLTLYATECQVDRLNDYLQKNEIKSCVIFFVIQTGI